MEEKVVLGYRNVGQVSMLSFVLLCIVLARREKLGVKAPGVLPLTDSECYP
jgi:hypothetical protein